MLFLLAVLSAASAAPAPDAQVPLSPLYNPYLHYYPQYQQQRYLPQPMPQAQVPFYYYPPYPQYGIQTSPTSRAIINLGGFLQEGAAFTAMAAVTTSGSEMSAKTLTGDITFFQNPFTLNNAKYHVNLPNVAANTPIGIYIHAAGGDCGNTAATATGITELTKLTTPIFQINGAYVDGTTSLVNLDGAGSKTDISGRRISIRDESGTTPASIIGCSSAGLA